LAVKCDLRGANQCGTLQKPTFQRVSKQSKGNIPDGHYALEPTSNREILSLGLGRAPIGSSSLAPVVGKAISGNDRRCSKAVLRTRRDGEVSMRSDSRKMPFCQSGEKRVTAMREENEN
jgi:hypothetical protein